VQHLQASAARLELHGFPGAHSQGDPHDACRPSPALSRRSRHSFEVRDTDDARQQLQKVRLVTKPCRRPNALDRRIAAVVSLIQFKHTKERRKFTLVVLNTEEFDQLPIAYQQLILAAECALQETDLAKA
jgi:hypothetical protein